MSYDNDSGLMLTLSKSIACQSIIIGGSKEGEQNRNTMGQIISYFVTIFGKNGTCNKKLYFVI